jgi:hypothetical protein
MWSGGAAPDWDDGEGPGPPSGSRRVLALVIILALIVTGPAFLIGRRGGSSAVRVARIPALQRVAFSAEALRSVDRLQCGPGGPTMAVPEPGVSAVHAGSGADRVTFSFSSGADGVVVVACG